MTYTCFCGSKLDQTELSGDEIRRPNLASLSFEAYLCPKCHGVYLTDEQAKTALENTNRLKSRARWSNISIKHRDELVPLELGLYDEGKIIERIEEWTNRHNMLFHYLESHAKERLEDWKDLLGKYLKNLPKEHTPKNLGTLIEDNMVYLLKNYPKRVDDIMKYMGLTGLLTMVAQNACADLSAKLKPNNIDSAFKSPYIGLMFIHFYEFKEELAKHLKIGEYDPVEVYERIKGSLKKLYRLDGYPFEDLDSIVYKFLKSDENQKKFRELLVGPVSSPNDWIPPIIYIASILIGEKITGRKISEASNTTETTLWKKDKIIIDNFEINVKL